MIRRPPMSADEVRGVIRELDAGNRNKAARLAMARAAVRIGNVTEEGRHVWRDCLAANEGAA